MTRAVKGAWILFAVALAAVAVGIVRMEREAARRALLFQTARDQNLELRALEDLHRKLAADQLPVGEIKILQHRREEVEALRHRLAALRQRVAWEKDHPSSRPESETVPASAWIYAGQKTPKAAFESALWSASRGDVDKLAQVLTFGPKVQAGLESLISQLPPASRQDYGTPQKLIATLMAGSFPENVSAITPEGESETGNGAALSIRIDYADGHAKDTLFSFVRTPDGWRLVVPTPIASTYAMTVFGPSGQKK